MDALEVEQAGVERVMNLLNVLEYIKMNHVLLCTTNAGILGSTYNSNAFFTTKGGSRSDRSVPRSVVCSWICTKYVTPNWFYNLVVVFGNVDLSLDLAALHDTSRSRSSAIFAPGTRPTSVPALPDCKKPSKAGKRSSMAESTLPTSYWTDYYDCYNLNLTGMKCFSANRGPSWSQQPPDVILHPVDLKTKVHSCIATIVPWLPSYKISGNLPSFELHLSYSKQK